VYQQWEHWHLREIDLTIENIDIHRKGYITLEDLARFMGVRIDEEFRTRDVYLIYQRFLNGSFSQDRVTQFSSNNTDMLKFRTVIDSLIKPFSKLRENRPK
jgi:hypothetical protein